jgi:hypothetical protein
MSVFKMRVEIRTPLIHESCGMNFFLKKILLSVMVVEPTVGATPNAVPYDDRNSCHREV